MGQVCVPLLIHQDSLRPVFTLVLVMRLVYWALCSRASNLAMTLEQLTNAGPESIPEVSLVNCLPSL